MKKLKLFVAIICLEILVIICVSVANLLNKWGYALFYNVAYGLLVSTIIPILYVVRKNEKLEFLGIKKLRFRQYVILVLFVLFSVGGQLIPSLFSKEVIRFELITISIIPLIMTTFFEEFLFRGFIQTRVEKEYGCIIAILVSGTLFSLYHIGYPGFRDLHSVLLLFAVGVGFALAYKLSDNNLIVAYFVNLPNSLVTYIFKVNQFPEFTKSTSIFAFITICVIVSIFMVCKKAKLFHR